MKNKVNLKKLLLCINILLIFLLSLFLVINIYEYHIYNKNYNKKVLSIVNIIEEKYPNITEEELIDVISNEDYSDTFFKQFSIDIQRDSILKKIKIIFIYLQLLIYCFIQFL